VNFGPTHEITLSYRFAGKGSEETNNRKSSKRKSTAVVKKPKVLKETEEF
jgi:hypothetical protein